MNFTSLNDALSKNFIKSLPHLTRLDLSANEIKLIELILSFTEKGNVFYMNYSNIAEYLHLGNTKNKSKSVGNIVAKLKSKGYIISKTTHNFNGKNGGSSSNLKVDETFLEGQLHAFFNPVKSTPPEGDIRPVEETQTIEAEVILHSEINPAKSFTEELEESENQGEKIVHYDELEPVISEPESIADDADIMGYQNIETVSEFVAMLRRLMRKDSMNGKKSAIQYMIDNSKVWTIDEMIQAFDPLVLKPLL